MEDFLNALEEIKPAFGIDNQELENNLQQGIIDYSNGFSQVINACRDFISEIKNS